MWLSAVSFSAALLSFHAQDGMTAPLSTSLAKTVAPRVITLADSGVILGQAVFIAPEGYAIAPGEAAFAANGEPRKSIRASYAQQRDLPIRVLAFDPVTDLALIHIPMSTEELARTAVPTNRITQSVVLVALPGGPVRGHVTRTNVPGVIGLSRRFMPLNEIRLEGDSMGIAGAPVFSSEGKLIGILMAALSNDPLQETAARRSANADLTGFGPRTAASPAGSAVKAIGPQSPATAFALDSDVLVRVIQGFLSPTRSVQHPWVGLYFKSSPIGGAEVTEVKKDSPAEKSGLAIGDVIRSIAGKSIANHVELATQLFRLPVGSIATIEFQRSGVLKKVTVRVGTEPITQAKLQRLVIGEKG